MSEANKTIAVAFYKQALVEGDVENAFRAYAGPTYRQHNPHVGDGMDDCVVLHSHWYGLSDNPRGEAVVDIFRLQNGKMVEHWDVIQPIPETAANNNTMF